MARVYASRETGHVAGAPAPAFAGGGAHGRAARRGGGTGGGAPVQLQNEHLPPPQSEAPLLTRSSLLIDERLLEPPRQRQLSLFDGTHWFWFGQQK